MKKQWLLTVLAASLVVVTAWAVNGRVMASNDHHAGNDSVVGVWEVDADAPYRPHLFTFHADGTLSSTNPTNVQENTAAPHGGTNDSVGMGVWQVTREHNQTFVVGTFEELNAWADNHQPTDKLSVSFKLKLSDNGKQFDGPASASLGTQTVPSHLHGARVVVDADAVKALP